MNENEPTRVNIRAKLKPFQKRIIDIGFDFSERYLVVMCNRQVGKSFALKLLSFMYLCEKPNQAVGYVTLTQRLGRKFYSDMVKFIPKRLVAKANSVELVIELVNGSSMYFWSGENIEVCRGFSLEYLIVDECAFSKEEVNGQSVFNNVLAPMLDARGKKCIFSSTPFAKTGLFWEAYNRAVKKEPGWGLVVKTVYDEMEECGVTDEWIAEKKRLIGEAAFACEYECKFKSFDEVSYFKGFEQLFAKPLNRPHKKSWFGIDFSSVGEDRTVVTRIDEDNNVTQWNIIGNLDEKYKQIADIVNAEEATIQDCIYESNSIGEIMSNSIKKLLKPGVKSKWRGQATTTKTKPDMVNNLARAIEAGELRFDINNRELLSELGTFIATVNPNTKYVTYAAMEGRHDDFVMSLVIALYSKTRKANSGGTPFLVVKR